MVKTASGDKIALPAERELGDADCGVARTNLYSADFLEMNTMAVRLLLDESAKGVYIISATPFADAGEIDFDSTDRLIDFYVDSGVHGVTILGVMGEAPKLSAEESIAFSERVLKRVAGRIPVVVGVSSTGNLNLKRLTDKVMSLGAAGVMLSPIGGMWRDEKNGVGGCHGVPRFP